MLLQGRNGRSNRGRNRGNTESNSGDGGGGNGDGGGGGGYPAGYLVGPPGPRGPRVRHSKIIPLAYGLIILIKKNYCIYYV